MTQKTPPHSHATQSELSESTRRALVRLIVVALLLPVSFEVAGFRLTPALIVMMGLFPILVTQYAKRTVTWHLPDLLFSFYIIWQGLTILLNNPERVVAFTGQQTLLTMVGFLAGRLLVLHRQDFYHLIIVVGVASMISMPFALYEAVFDDPIILRLIADYTPFNTFNQNTYEPRLGLYRAQFVFTHPIHFGLMGALTLVPFFVGLKDYLSNGPRIMGTLLIGVACFLSVSSGAVLSVILQLILFICHFVASGLQRPWRAILISGGLLYAVLEVLSTKSAFVAISGRLAFNSSTAYYRTLIWQYGSQQVRRTPFFGNGYNEWERPLWMVSSSVDNHWLLMAMVHGMPAVVFMGCSIFYAFVMVNRYSSLTPDPALKRLRLSWTLTMIGFCMSASTVAIWGEIQLLFTLLFGAGFWMIGPSHDLETQDQAEDTTPSRPSRVPRYTRFSSGARPTSRTTSQRAPVFRRELLTNHSNRRSQ